MSVFVIDASVGIKWFVPEPGDTEAYRLLVGHSLHVPSLFFPEMANALRKKALKGEISVTVAQSSAVRLVGLGLTAHLDEAAMELALDIAFQTGISSYDAFYLALAVHLGGQLVTADDAFVAKIAGTTWAASVIRLRDVP